MNALDTVILIAGIVGGFSLVCVFYYTGKLFKIIWKSMTDEH